MKYRLARHLAFWLIMYFGEASMMTFIPIMVDRLAGNMLREYFLIPVLYLPAQMLLVYSLLYYAIPRLILKGKYKTAIAVVAVLVFLSTIVAGLTYAVLVDTIRLHFFVFRLPLLQQDPFTERMRSGLVWGSQAVLRVAGFAAAIKLLKYWYENEYRNAILQKEKLNAELQSLKAQVHPHFLFNTLNNIYSIAEKTSPLASEIVLKLSELLRYILYECDRPFVPLIKEMRLIGDYIELEKIRYNHLDLSVQLPDNVAGYEIPPLLLLPLVENCFKHGTSKMLEQPWIKIDAGLKEGALMIKLINGRPPGESRIVYTEGIGLRNVRKRMELLYPGKYELTILSEEDVFIVNCRLTLTLANG